MHDLHVSVITVLEVEIGVARLERRDPARGVVLRRWFEDDLLPAFAERTVPVDLDAVRLAAAVHVPDPRPERDALIAASAIARGLVVVTRNTRDFASLGVDLLDPWEQPVG